MNISISTKHILCYFCCCFISKTQVKLVHFYIICKSLHTLYKMASQKNYFGWLHKKQNKTQKTNLISIYLFTRTIMQVQTREHIWFCSGLFLFMLPQVNMGKPFNPKNITKCCSASSLQNINFTVNAFNDYIWFNIKL